MLYFTLPTNSIIYQCQLAQVRLSLRLFRSVCVKNIDLNLQATTFPSNTTQAAEIQPRIILVVILVSPQKENVLDYGAPFQSIVREQFSKFESEGGRKVSSKFVVDRSIFRGEDQRSLYHTFIRDSAYAPDVIFVNHDHFDLQRRGFEFVYHEVY